MNKDENMEIPVIISNLESQLLNFFRVLFTIPVNVCQDILPFDSREVTLTERPMVHIGPHMFMFIPVITMGWKLGMYAKREQRKHVCAWIWNVVCVTDNALEYIHVYICPYIHAYNIHLSTFIHILYNVPAWMHTYIHTYRHAYIHTYVFIHVELSREPCM